jgi:hypothetical protein
MMGGWVLGGLAQGSAALQDVIDAHGQAARFEISVGMDMSNLYS